MRKWAVRLCILELLVAGALLAQQTYTKGDAEQGRNLFLQNCAGCHGPDGDAIPGFDLGHGKFRRANSDDDLIDIILIGIPGTGMPANDDLSHFEVQTIVAYLRYMASTAPSASVTGDALRGRAIFEGKGACLTCHRVKDRGSRLGPDLTDIGSIRRSIDLQRSILEPDAEVLPENRFVRVVTKNGVVITGRLLNHGDFTVQLMDTKEQLLSFQISTLREYSILDKSTMPSYKGKLSAQEISDLVSYLVSLKGIPVQ